MPRYVVLVKHTDQGIRTIKEARSKIEESKRASEAAGIKILAHYFVMGEYDAVAIVEAPSDEVLMAHMVALNARGEIRTTTLRAFTDEEFGEILKKLS